MTSDCVFCKIISGQIPSTQLYQDDTVTAFHDIHPVAPIHILIVPNKHISSNNDIAEADEQTIGHMFYVASKLAIQEKIAERGYRLIINTGPDGGQEIFHLHLHLLGGRKLGTMIR